MSAARRRDLGSRAIKIACGVLLMAASVLIVFGVLARYAGGWGVPYFSFTTERGSRCTNTLTGYVCDQISRDDINYWADVALPSQTRVVSGRYTLTHDYVLQAQVEFPPADADRGLKNLRTAFGPCVRDHPSPLKLDGLARTCVLANDAVGQVDAEQAGRVYVVGTGARPDGTRVAVISLRSR